MNDPEPKIHTGVIVPENDLRVRLFTDYFMSKAAIARMSEGEVLVHALPGERVLNRSDRPPVIQKLDGHRIFGMNPGERVTMRGGVIRSRQLLQDPEPEPVPHPDDGLPDPGNGRPCPPDTKGGCPEEPPRPIPDPSPPRPGGPVVV